MSFLAENHLALDFHHYVRKNVFYKDFVGKTAEALCQTEVMFQKGFLSHKFFEA